MQFMRDHTALQRIVQGLFFAALAVVVAATVTPAPDLPVAITWNDKFLHFIAYFGLGLLGGTGWPARRSVLLIVMPLFGLALEGVQGGMVPGRSFDWYDGLANALGALAGVGLSVLARRMIFRTA